MMLQKLVVVLAWVFLPVLAFAQQGTIKGTVTDETGMSLPGASISVNNQAGAAQTNAAGKFTLTLPAEQDITLRIKYLGFEEQSVILRLQAAENREIRVQLLRLANALAPVVISGQRTSNPRYEAGLITLQPRLSKEIPTVSADFTKILATLPGVVSNNELTSTYSVRGGNYDENLVYVNGMEIYRPFLISNAQQEGLSFVNLDMVQNVEFSTGGWQPRLGDKLSSVLDITYKTPRQFAGSVTAGFMGGGAHLEAASKNKRVTYLAGLRYKNTQLVLESLETNGNYQPNFTDAQTYIQIDLTKGIRDRVALPKTTLGILTSVARNQYRVIPSFRETSFGTTSHIVRLGIQYGGHERLEYETYQGGLHLMHLFTPRLTTELIVSSMLSYERELRDIAATYSFHETMPDGTPRDPNEKVRTVDAGTSFDHSRNALTARISALENRYTWQPNSRHTLRAGLKVSQEIIRDKLQEYNLQDSADYVTIDQQLSADLTMHSYRFQGFGQHTIYIDSLRSLTYGARVSYWSLNGEINVSPRLQYNAVLPANPNWTLKLAAGYYYQPPFYRELRDHAGRLNKDLKAQRSMQVIAGAGYRFIAWSRPFKLTTEAYYKHLTQVIPYEIDNVRLRYYAQNNARAYAAGLDVRVNGEFIKGAESWFSLGILTTKENITGDSTTVDFKTFKTIPKQALGYIRRPTDQRVTLGVFFQDHIPHNPTLKMYLNGVLGTGLPFSPPGQEGIRNQFHMPIYKRVDIGFSKLITFREASSDKRNYLESLWLSLEVLNLIAANNVVSYNYVKDLHHITYAVPNYLSSRLVNLRFIARF